MPLPFPLTAAGLAPILAAQPTPFHLYDEQAIRVNARNLQRAFAWHPGFREYFAVKATPNPHILAILVEEGCGLDCSSATELMLAARIGVGGSDVLFTSNDTPPEEFVQAAGMGALINLDDLAHLPILAAVAGLPEILCLRYNPGAVKRGNAIIGAPEQAKFGMTRSQLIEGYRLARDQGVKRFGLHAMVASNELDPAYFIETAELLFGLVVEITQMLGIRFEFVNIGGGLGIPYRPGEAPMDVDALSQGIRRSYESIITAQGCAPIKLFMECGRFMTGPYGYLVARVRHLKHTYKRFAGLDACMADLMRPAIYGAYHHISILGKEEARHDTRYDVTGSLCENNDKFAIDRDLPALAVGDIVILHDTGAHGYAMGFNYNGKLRSAELLLAADGRIRRIRRAERAEDYFATLEPFFPTHP